MNRPSSSVGRARGRRPHPARAARVTLGVASGATYVGLTATIGLAVQAEATDDSAPDAMPSSLALADEQFTGAATPAPAIQDTESATSTTRASVSTIVPTQPTTAESVTTQSSEPPPPERNLRDASPATQPTATPTSSLQPQATEPSTTQPPATQPVSSAAPAAEPRTGDPTTTTVPATTSSETSPATSQDSVPGSTSPTQQTTTTTSAAS